MKSIQTQLMDELAHSMLSAGIDHAVSKGLPNQQGIDSTKAILEAINKTDPNKAQAIITMSVRACPGPDGQMGYEINGGIAGSVNMLSALVTLISKQIMELSESDQVVPAPPAPNAPSSTTVQ